MNKLTNKLIKKLILPLTALVFGLILSNSVIADNPDAGQMAPDFSISQLDGSPFNLSDYRGKKSVYLVFWNTWCTFCMKKIPKLKAIAQDLPDDIQIIAVNTTNKDSIEESLEFQQRFEITYPLAFDTGKKVTDLYNVWGTPTEFIIDIDGMIRHRDGVPDNIENQLAAWNTSYVPLTQILAKYIKSANDFFRLVCQTC